MSNSSKPDAEASSVSPSEKGHSVVNRDVTDHQVENQFELVHTPHLHAKTFLAVTAVCLIYIAQTFTLVGAGAVSLKPHELPLFQTPLTIGYSKAKLSRDISTALKMSPGLPHPSRL